MDSAAVVASFVFVFSFFISMLSCLTRQSQMLLFMRYTNPRLVYFTYFISVVQVARNS